MPFPKPVARFVRRRTPAGDPGLGPEGAETRGMCPDAAALPRRDFRGPTQAQEALPWAGTKL